MQEKKKKCWWKLVDERMGRKGSTCCNAIVTGLIVAWETHISPRSNLLFVASISLSSSSLSSHFSSAFTDTRAAQFHTRVSQNCNSVSFVLWGNRLIKLYFQLQNRSAWGSWQMDTVGILGQVFCFSIDVSLIFRLKPKQKVCDLYFFNLLLPD